VGYDEALPSSVSTRSSFQEAAGAQKEKEQRKGEGGIQRIFMPPPWLSAKLLAKGQTNFREDALAVKLGLQTRKRHAGRPKAQAGSK